METRYSGLMGWCRGAYFVSAARGLRLDNRAAIEAGQAWVITLLLYVFYTIISFV